MKKTAFLIMICTILACLTSCGTHRPATAVDGTPWSKDWITIGPTLGVEEPGHGLTLRDTKGARNMYYTAWSIGEGRPYTDASGEETALYDAQLVLLVVDSDTAEDAQTSVDEWLDLAEDNYIIIDTTQQIYNGQEFTVLTYTFPPDTSPFVHGTSAFTTYNGWAISAELVCQNTFEEDEQNVLADFLTHCHYAAE